MSMANKELLAIVRAHHARRKFNLSLEQLCLETIARNDEFFATNAAQSATLCNDLVPSLKTQILAELSEQVFGHPRYPATKHRVKLVQLLIHPRLEEFDFAACGDKFGKVTNQQVWKCLAETAGQRLRCVRDLRIKSHAQKTRTLAWCLPYLTLMPNLEKLWLTTLCCSSGELVQVVKATPKLETLQLFFNNSVIDAEREIKSVLSMRSLEELIICSHNDRVQGLLPILLREMPQLKINCMRTDEPYMYHKFYSRHQKEPGMRGPFKLEHICVVMNAPEEYQFCSSEIPNVKHLMLAHFFGPTFPIAPIEDYSKCFPNLETIHFKGCNFSTMVVPTLRVNGKFITNLILDSHNHVLTGIMYDLYWILENCPHLTDLTLKKIHSSPLSAHRFVDPAHVPTLPLKVLKVFYCILDRDFLHSLLQRAPQLEELVLDSIFSLDDDMLLRPAGLLAKKEFSLANLHSFKLSLFRQEGIFQYYQLEDIYACSYEFVKNMLTSCPNLRQVEVDLQEDRIGYAEIIPLDNILDIVND